MRQGVASVRRIFDGVSISLLFVHFMFRGFIYLVRFIKPHPLVITLF